MKNTRTALAIFASSLLFAFVAVDCGFGVWFQEVILTSSVKNPQPIPPFTIPPKDTATKYLEFLAVGDAGTGRAGQRDIADGMGRKAAENPVSFVLVLGDNFYASGVSSVTDEQWERKFEKMYSHTSLQVPFHAVLGNHDYYTNPQAQVEYTGVSPSKRWKMPARYYTFSEAIDDTCLVQFFCLDTTPLDAERVEEIEEGQTIETVDYREQLKWFEEQIQLSNARWKIVTGHHALYSGGSHGDNKGMIALLEPIFVRHNVDVYIAGHDHHQELKKPIKGVHYIVSGAGGTHRSVTWQDNTIFAMTNMGFTWLRLSARELLVEFFDREGNLLYAHVVPKM
ncbi:MAG: metallophosphoesterase [Ignavibacteriales bacterium]|nr:metallophosphoesterase [Ignavibacteriales bacterium]